MILDGSLHTAVCIGIAYVVLRDEPRSAPLGHTQNTEETSP